MKVMKFEFTQNEVLKAVAKQAARDGLVKEGDRVQLSFVIDHDAPPDACFTCTLTVLETP